MASATYPAKWLTSAIAIGTSAPAIYLPSINMGAILPPCRLIKRKNCRRALWGVALRRILA